MRACVRACVRACACFDTSDVLCVYLRIYINMCVCVCVCVCARSAYIYTHPCACAHAGDGAATGTGGRGHACRLGDADSEPAADDVADVAAHLVYALAARCECGVG